MKELSEKELENEYKDLKMTDVPDMWADIERNLAPKESKEPDDSKPSGEDLKLVPIRMKNRIPIKKIASMAAVVAAVLLLVPVAHVIQKGTLNSMDMSGSSDMEAAESAGADMAASTEASTAAGGQSAEITDTIAENAVAGAEEAAAEEAVAETDAAKQEGGPTSQGTAESTVMNQEGSAGWQEAQEEQKETGKAPNSEVLQVEVKIEQVKEIENGVLLSAEVLECSDNSYQPGEVLDIVYEQEKGSYEVEGSSYGEEDFAGTMRLRIEKTEENLKLLEILP